MKGAVMMRGIAEKGVMGLGVKVDADAELLTIPVAPHIVGAVIFLGAVGIITMLVNIRHRRFDGLYRWIHTHDFRVENAAEDSVFDCTCCHTFVW